MNEISINNLEEPISGDLIIPTAPTFTIKFKANAPEEGIIGRPLFKEEIEAIYMKAAEGRYTPIFFTQKGAKNGKIIGWQQGPSIDAWCE